MIRLSVISKYCSWQFIKTTFEKSCKISEVIKKKESEFNFAFLEKMSFSEVKSNWELLEALERVLQDSGFCFAQN